MSRSRALIMAVSAAVAIPLGVVALSQTSSAAAGLARSPEQSATTRLADRRSVVIGDRFYEVGAEDGSYPASGFHTRGEMGGFWTPPIKLLDGIWFNLNGQWLSAEQYSTGWGYARMDLGSRSGVSITRTDFAPDGLRAGLIGLTFTAGQPRAVSLTVDAHSELMKSYPWGETSPSQLTYNLPDSVSYNGNSLVFREVGTPPVANAEPHDYAALVGSSLQPVNHATGTDFRGPQDPAVICPASGPNAPPQPDRCDDTAYGQGAGGQLHYSLKLPAGSSTVWFAIAGSDHGLAEARAQQTAALANPAGLLVNKVAGRQTLDSRTNVNLPGDPLLQSSVAWSKQNLADSVQESRNLAVRVDHAGTAYPAPSGTLDKARWIGAGWPDYPWLFATDGEYSAFAAVAAGQFDPIEDHLRALRDVSLIANGDTGKVVHEVTPDGAVYFGANDDPGNTDETAKFPSAVALVWRWTGDAAFRDEMYPFAVKNLQYIFRNLDADNDGWPEGLGNVERTGMGAEKLDNTVYTIRGLRDLADLAASKGDSAIQSWATNKAADLESRFESAWWFGPTANQYADSLADPGDVQVFQRHWIGVTPVEAELVRPGQVAGPLAETQHARLAVAKREEPCYSGEFGLFHTGTGATTAAGGNAGPTCDSAISSVGSERSVFTLNTSIMATAEAALGRLGADQLQRYTTANARVQLDPLVSETPGDMPEISPSPDFGANIDRKFTERSMALQAWGTYGILWPVVHFELGIAPDLGRGSIAVVPQVPDGQSVVSGTDVRLGAGSIDVAAYRAASSLTTSTTRYSAMDLTIGAVLPTGRTVASVTLNGAPASYSLVTTARGQEVRVAAGGGTGVATLVVKLA
jgi:hypothetical protein